MRTQLVSAAKLPDAGGHFGPFGGRFVPEALVAALDELTVAYDEAMDDPKFTDELTRLLSTYAGRPTRSPMPPGCRSMQAAHGSC